MYEQIQKVSGKIATFIITPERMNFQKFLLISHFHLLRNVYKFSCTRDLSAYTQQKEYVFQFSVKVGDRGERYFRQQNSQVFSIEFNHKYR